MKSDSFGVHEITDIRELINFKWSCLVKAKERMDKVDNSELRELVDESIKSGKTTVNELRGLLISAENDFGQ